jgi:hypothetical protein
VNVKRGDQAEADGSLKAMFRDKRDVRLIVRLVKCYCSCVIQENYQQQRLSIIATLSLLIFPIPFSSLSHSMHETVCCVYLALNWFRT